MERRIPVTAPLLLAVLSVAVLVAAVSALPDASASSSRVRVNVKVSSSSSSSVLLNRKDENTTYTPVFFMHGVGATEHKFDNMVKVLADAHPGQWLYELNIYNEEASFLPLWTQVHGVYTKMQNLIAAEPDRFKDGYHLVCHSQGTMICRGIIEAYDDHNVQTFVSLAGPLLGEYGPYLFLQNLLPNVTVPNLYRALYTPLFQSTLSAANFWNDPHQHDLYLKEVVFLPVINNEIPGQENADYKANFLRVKRVELFGSPADASIIPWYSSMFEYYDNDMRRVPLEKQYVYTADTFGLRTMVEEGRLHRTEVPNVAHNDWVTDPEIVRQYTLPILV